MLRINSFFCLIFLTANIAASPAPLYFPQACSTGETLTIAAVGDILLHRPLQIKGTQDGFKSLWEEALPYLQHAQIAYGNLEGPIADDMGYTGYPTFNYPPAVADALYESGFDIISTANNHALDRSRAGIHKTMQNLDRVGVSYAGTRHQHEDASWVKLIKKNNITTAWIACTQHTNGINDTHNEILYCYSKRDYAIILNLIQEFKNKVDAIIVTPHWGDEYQSKANIQQQNFAHEVLNAGATMVLGSHPHVLQPMEKFVTLDGRNTLIVYSLGNFVSYQGSPRMKSTIILLVGLTKTPSGTIINGVKFVPMEMNNRQGINYIKINKINHNKNSTINNVMPKENIFDDTKMVTNPECHI